MDRVEQVLQHSLYKECLEKICELEDTREFCGHDMTHFLDVARLAYIFNIEQQLGIEKELIYTAALLHDIGRGVEYTKETPHNEAGVPLAEKILIECGYCENERSMILEAILRHCDIKVKEEQSLAGIIYRADKQARACFSCQAEQSCNWDKKKKNLRIEY